MVESDEEVNLTLISDEPTPRGGLPQSQFFSTIENAVSIGPIVEFFNSSNEGKKRRKDAELLVGKLNKVKSRRLFAALLPLLNRTVEEECYSYRDEEEEGEEKKDGEDFNEAAALQSLQFLKLCADLLNAHVCTIKKTAMDEVFDMATLLHDSLFVLHQCSANGVEGSANGNSKVGKQAAAASASIFLLCEKWWHLNLDDREQMVTQLIPLLLLSSLDEKATRADVKRLYSMREAFDLLDFTDPSIASLHTQLLRTVSHPLFLQSAEGKRFISHLFTLPELTGSLHAVVKVQILSKKSVLGCYGEIYWGAWKSLATAGSGSRERAASIYEDDEEDEREVAMKSIEENALQPLAYMTIHATNPTVAKNCQLILDKFLLYKKDPEVESLLYRLYGPILWRSCNAANAKVRMQAAVVLGDTFPLMDGASTRTSVGGGKAKSGYEAVVTKTVETIVKLMRDEVPSVRVQGCICSGKILGGFWVAIPSADIRMLLNEIIARHSSDTASAVVRTTAIHTITSLLAEDKTHAVLRPLLPSLGNVIHDKTEKVRLAVVRMLLVVKKLKSMKYYHVVPAKHLLARLADEGRGKNNPTGPVARGLTELLSNSFFPTGSKKTMADVIGRTFRLIQDDPAAALVFYRNASTQLSVHSIVKLISALMKCLCFLIVEEKKGAGEDVSGLDLSVVVEEGGLDCSDGGIVGGSRMVIILESISVLWESIENDLKQADDAINQSITEAFTGNILTEVFCHFEDKCNSTSQESKWNEGFRALFAILNCAGRLDHENVDGLRTHIMAMLETSWDLPVEQRARSNYSPYTSLLCAWGMSDDVFKCLSSSISHYLEGGESEQPKKKKARGNKADPSLPLLHIDVALNIIGHTLHGAHPLLAGARESLLNCEPAYAGIVSALHKAQSFADKILRTNGSLDVNDYVIRNVAKCIECHGKLLLHNDAQRTEAATINLSEQIKSLITWISDSVAPSLIKLIGQDNTLRELDISGISGLDSPMNSPDAMPSRNGARNSSFGLSESGTGRGSFNVYQDTCNIKTAVASMRSVLLMISDWLSICRTSHSFITNNLVNWAQVLRCDETVRKPLLPLFSRIALLCLQIDGDSALFDEISMFVESAELTEDEAQYFASSICGGLAATQENSIKSWVSSFIKTICSVAQKHHLMERDGTNDDSILEKLSPGIYAWFMAMINDNRCSVILAQHLVKDKSLIARADLLNAISSHAVRTGSLNKILEAWDAQHEVVEDDEKEESTVEPELLHDAA